MKEPPSHEVTHLLQAWSEGDEGALDQLMPLVYSELHRLAERYMAGERPGHTLQTTALVNEAYLRLVDVKQVSWQNRAHFFAVSAQFMRRILVEFARSRQSRKRGGGAPPLRGDHGHGPAPPLASGGEGADRSGVLCARRASVGHRPSARDTATAAFRLAARDAPRRAVDAE